MFLYKILIQDVEFARKGDEVCVKIEAVPGEAPKMFGRHFDDTDLLISRVSIHPHFYPEPNIDLIPDP